MIARLLQALWLALLMVVAASAFVSAKVFGPAIGAPLAALLGVLPWLLLHPAAVAGNFILSRAFGDPVPAPHRLSWWRTLVMVDREIDASLRGVWYANPFLSRRIAPASSGTRRHALLFVHGFLCNRAVWHPFMTDAAQRGYRCEAVTLTDPFGTIDGHAQTVANALASLGSAGSTVCIVAHSMGALAVRSALRTIDASRIAHVVTLGAPHHGTWSARFGRDRATRQMRRGNDWLAALAEEEVSDAKFPRTNFTSIATAHDEIVFPQTTSHLEGATNVVIGGCGHVDLLYAPAVRTLVFDRLDSLDGRQAAVGS